MKILGIDPAVNTVGYGLVEKIPRCREKVICSGVISSPPKNSFCDKAGFIIRTFDGLLEDLAPDIVVIEEIFLGKNVQVTLKIGQVMGIVIGASLRKGIPFELLSTREVKQSITGTGAATKAQVRFMLEHMTGYRDFKKDDESDAVAVAVTYLTHKKTNDLLNSR